MVQPMRTNIISGNPSTSKAASGKTERTRSGNGKPLQLLLSGRRPLLIENGYTVLKMFQRNFVADD